MCPFWVGDADLDLQVILNENGCQRKIYCQYIEPSLWSQSWTRGSGDRLNVMTAEMSNEIRCLWIRQSDMQPSISCVLLYSFLVFHYSSLKTFSTLKKWKHSALKNVWLIMKFNKIDIVTLGRSNLTLSSYGQGLIIHGRDSETRWDARTKTASATWFLSLKLKLLK